MTNSYEGGYALPDQAEPLFGDVISGEVITVTDEIIPAGCVPWRRALPLPSVPAMKQRVMEAYQPVDASLGNNTDCYM